MSDSDPRAQRHGASTTTLPLMEVFEQAAPGRKGQILAAALEVFSTRGYSAGSMREIAGRVGVTEPALYRHFPGKDAIFLALIRVVGGRTRDEGCKLIAELEPETLREQIVAAFADRRKAMRRYGPLLRTVVTTVPRNPQFLAEYRSAVIGPLHSQLTAKAIELDAAFGLPDGDATRDSRVRALLALLVGYLFSSFIIGDEVDEGIADAALSVMGWRQFVPNARTSTRRD